MHIDAIRNLDYDKRMILEKNCKRVGGKKAERILADIDIVRNEMREAFADVVNDIREIVDNIRQNNILENFK